MRAKRLGGSARHGAWRRALTRGGFVLASVGCAVGVGWWLWSASGAPVMHAEGGPLEDSDGDGLPDALEVVIGTRSDRFDTDFDGFGDGEEIARSSHPARANSVPSNDVIGVGMDAFLLRDKVHMTTAIYVPDSQIHGKTLSLGIASSGGLVPVSLRKFGGGHGVRSVASQNGSGRVYVLDPVVAKRVVVAKGGFALFAGLSQNGTYLAADAVNLVVDSGEIFEHLALGTTSSNGSQGMGVGLGIGGVYRPIDNGTNGGSAPYVVGQICAQTTMVVGVVGAVVTQEVVDADCVSGWDAHCSPGCSASVGSTFRSIDPATLVGG